MSNSFRNLAGESKTNIILFPFNCIIGMIKTSSGIIKVLLLSAILVLIQGCRSDYDYPLEPVLKFLDFIYVENSEGIVEQGILVLEFTDGDGDIGLGQGDTMPPFNYGGGHYHNFYINLYTLDNGKYNPVVFPDTSFNFHSRIPKIEFTGNSKSIRGEIEYKFDMLIMKPFLQSDTIMIETWITDRALHKSNIVMTPDIPVR